ncbi:MAG: hypothetical protein IJK95_02415 [Firmicutes bacterium]|nr:hypothetical protein [Bacillota bacterium]MBQ6088394.1 hypothetical protein [Bacillota bacterium]
MINILDIVGTSIWNVIAALSILLSIPQLGVLIRAIRNKRQKKILVLLFLIFLLDLMIFISIIDCSLQARPDLIKLEPTSYELLLSGTPWIVYASMEAVMVICLIFSLRATKRYPETHLTQEAIKETVNLLPMAICISDTVGTVLLVNPKMNELSKALFGSLLTDSVIFWQKIQKNYSVQEGVYPVAMSDGRVWLFSRDKIHDDDNVYYQIMAYDITEQYRITDELSQKNKQLKNVQLRMKSVSAKEFSLVAAREIMNARVTVHNQLGNVLLTGKYYLDHMEDMNEAELLNLLTYSNNFFIMEAEEPDDMADELNLAIHMARRIGVDVDITGDLPSSATARRLIAQAVEQCASNAVRHADADKLMLCCALSPDICHVTITNNGIPPASTIRESGGLASLRQSIEDAGGKMRIISQPEFRLELEISR